MNAILIDSDLEEKPPLSICPKCGRQVRIDGHCECESIFFNELKIGVKNLGPTQR